MNFSQETILHSLQKAPPAIKDIVGSEKLATIFQDIIKKNKIDIKQAGDVGAVMNYVLLGLVPMQEFTATLEKKSQLDTTKSRSVARDINERIFDLVRNDIKKHFEMKRQKKTSASSAQTQPKQTNMVPQPTQHMKQLANAPAVPNVPRSPHNPFEEKFKQNVQSEKRETRFREPSIKKDDDKVSIAEKKRPYSIDPYREPIE